MRKIVPADAVLIPTYATKVFTGEVFTVYQWGQEMFDGTIKRFEMLKRADTVQVISVRDDQIAVLKEEQPGKPEYMTLPSGRVQRSEDTMQAAARELTEATGLVFDKFHLVSVTQPNDMAEWFVYVYLATNFMQAVTPLPDGTERHKMAYMNFDEFRQNAVNNPRMASSFVSRFGSLEDMLKAPTFQGAPLDSEV